MIKLFIMILLSGYILKEVVNILLLALHVGMITNNQFNAGIGIIVFILIIIIL